MVASRIRVMGACHSAPFWLSAFCAALMPTSIGYQDLAALIARQSGAATSWREHLIASPFGTIETATFSYARPIGTSIPEPLALQTVSFDPSLDAKAWRLDEPLTARPARRIEYPAVNREGKGDRLPVSLPAPVNPASLPQLQPISAPPPSQPAQPAAPAAMPQAEHTDTAPPVAQMDAVNAVASATAPAAERIHDAVNAVQPRSVTPSDHDNVRGSAADDDIAVDDKPPAIPAPGESDDAPGSLDEMSFLDAGPGDRSAEVYFGNGAMGSPAGLQSWAPGAEPILAPPPTEDSDIKLSALEGADNDTGAGETVAGKDNSRLESPADRLGLSGKPRVQAEKCLADAVYFEARGEEMKGQEAVAQVVMNRVFSGYYPHDVCGVVYQNANRHLACQFTFACEGKDLSRIDEPDMWEQAKQIAKDTLDGKIWLAEVGHATHYHAYWVHPSWVHEMARLYKLGVHTFYRPLNWGDGDDEPVWGPSASKADKPADKPEAAAPGAEAAPKSSDATTKSPEAAVKGPQAAAAPTEPAAVKSAPTAL